MKYTERKEFVYDPKLGDLRDTRVALALADEYCRKFGSNPTPRFFEVDRSVGTIDELWHMPKAIRTKFLRELDIYAINQFQKPDWRLSKLGITYQRRDVFWMSNLSLAKADYFPLRGDQVYWSGYRYIIIDVGVNPEAYWGQTGVWTSLIVTCIVPAAGDAIPAFPQSKLAPAERPGVAG